jgi:hypothetical protein
MFAKFYSSKGKCSYHPDPDLWFPEYKRPNKPSNAERRLIAKRSLLAISICNKCPIQSECLEEGMKDENIEHGIWGGTLAGERILMAGVDTNRTMRSDAIAFAQGVRAWHNTLVD